MRNREPKSLEEFNDRFRENTWFEPAGMETTIHLPCPACAAAEFVSFPLLDIAEVVKLEQVCKECDRGVRLDMKPIVRGSASGYRWEFVQTRGDDFPDYLPVIRRLPIEPGKDA